jgi:prepilin-type N-terminal cleavage/methylation domain-containing protein
MTDRFRESGFTLLELLVSLIVLGLLVVGLNYGVRTGLDLLSMQSRQTSGTAELDSAYRVLRRLLTDIPRNPTSPINPATPPLAILFNGTADRLSFVGDLPTGIGTIRRADITILMREQSLLLSWKPHRHEFATTTPATMESELLHGVDRLEFAYFGLTVPGSSAGWAAEWAGPAIPELIRIHLGVSNAGARPWPDLIVAPQLATPET